jgi:hypothetical protein
VAFLSAGDHSLVASRERFEPLSHSLTLPPNSEFTLTFLLKAEEPFPLTAPELGLDRRELAPLRVEDEAKQLRQQFNSFAEVFAIVPLGQGLMARLVAGESGKNQANTLIITGIGLTAGSYLLGKILSSNRLSNIRSQNEEATRANDEAKDHNRQIEKQVQERNDEIIAEWRIQNADRGRVEVEEKPRE